MAGSGEAVAQGGTPKVRAGECAGAGRAAREQSVCCLDGGWGTAGREQSGGEERADVGRDHTVQDLRGPSGQGGVCSRRRH